MGEGQEANGEQSSQKAKVVPIEETEDEQGDREAGGRVEADKSAEEEERVVADRRCGDSAPRGEGARGRGPKEAGQRRRARGRW